MRKWFIHGACCYDKGAVRADNQDALFFNGQYAAPAHMNDGASWFTEVPAQGTLWAVCDGMGGHKNGEVASYTAISGMRELQNHLVGRDFEASIQNWVRQANSAVARKASGGGTTLALAYCGDGFLQTAHVGDSRVYRFHNGELYRLTRDHSKVEMLLAAGMITEEETFTHPQKNVITRYLGMKEEYVCEATVGKKQPFADGDRYLICSDGVCGMLDDRTIAGLLDTSWDVRSCADAILASVYEAGARDNLTAIVLELSCEGDPDPSSGAEEPLLFEDDGEEEPTEQDP